MKRSNLAVQLFIGLSFTLLTACSTSEKTTSTDNNNTENRQQRERPTATQIIEEMDSNNDGVLSKSEVSGPLANDFSTIDSNDDGLLTKTELENAPKPSGRPEGGRPRR